jgi:hypothetical protein
MSTSGVSGHHRLTTPPQLMTQADMAGALVDVCFWHLADMPMALCNIRFRG